MATHALSVRASLYRERHELALSSVEPDVGYANIFFIVKRFWIIFEPKGS